ncbi:MAG: leucyl aminopeptidase family protein [Caulobacteraceae bacterium]|nr:leucyl aminopeptidase family protein [Caulobacteraceae bacterium]
MRAPSFHPTLVSPAIRSRAEDLSDLAAPSGAVPIEILTRAAWAGRREAAGLAAWSSFEAKAGQALPVLGPDGSVERVLAGAGDDPPGLALVRTLAGVLPAGTYRLDPFQGLDPVDVAVMWATGAYRHKRPGAPATPGPRLFVDGADEPRTAAIASACALARDLVNAPANQMGPAELEVAARSLAEAHGATLTVVQRDELARDYPAVHAVGRAAGPSRQPRMIELAWGEAAHPLVAVIGKGVTFDSGGLDIKPAAGMRLMKKDMGGAAHALALASIVMARRLPVRLAVLVPAVENAISGDAMRPGDVIDSRKGLTIEVGNTDAEGRLILADALARAAEFDPAMTLDFATLTGAARVALGADLPPFYTDDEALAADLQRLSAKVADPMWRMPLWDDYAAGLESDIADLKNDPETWVQAGSIAAALFLKRFAPEGPWVRFDIFAWNARRRPGRPVGGEAQAVRAVFALLEERFA